MDPSSKITHNWQTLSYLQPEQKADCDETITNLKNYSQCTNDVSFVIEELGRKITFATSKEDMQQILQIRKQIKKRLVTDEEKAKFKQLSLKLYTEGMLTVFHCKAEQDQWKQKHQIEASSDQVRKMCEIFNLAIKPIRFFHGTSLSTLLALTHTDKTLKPTGTLMKENQTSFCGENAKGMRGINSHSISLTPSPWLNMALEYSKGKGPAGEDGTVSTALQNPQAFLQIVENLLHAAEKAFQQTPINHKELVNLSKDFENEQGANFLRGTRAALNCTSSGFENLKATTGRLLGMIKAEVETAIKKKKNHQLIMWLANFEKEDEEGNYEVYPECRIQALMDLLNGIMATQLPSKSYSPKEQKILKERPPMVLGMTNLRSNLTRFSDWEILHKGNLKLGQDIESLFVPEQYEEEVKQMVTDSFASDEKKPAVHSLESLELASKLSIYKNKKQAKYGATAAQAKG